MQTHRPPFNSIVDHPEVVSKFRMAEDLPAFNSIVDHLKINSIEEHVFKLVFQFYSRSSIDDSEVVVYEKILNLSIL